MARPLSNSVVAITEVKKLTDLSANLRPLVENVCEALYTRTYVLVDRHQQHGVIVVQKLPHDRTLGICKVYVDLESRQHGYGTLLMRKAEDVARSLGCSSVDLDAKPFDGSISDETLTEWYLNLGYEPSSVSSKVFRKNL